VVRAVFPGRFQPPHYGHLNAIKWALQKVDEIIIVIGSAQESHTIVNPFTAGERVVMIKTMLKEENLDLARFYVIPVPDIAMNHIWVRYLSMLVPSFSAVVSRNPLVIRLFKEAGYKVYKPPAFDRDEYMATRIRQLMLRGDQWKNYVPPYIVDLIEEFKGVERLREVSSKD